jgi:hypothetical protein
MRFTGISEVDGRAALRKPVNVRPGALIPLPVFSLFPALKPAFTIHVTPEEDNGDASRQY